MKKIDIWLEPENLKKIEKWASDGLTREQLAERLGVGVVTFRSWLKDCEPIAEAYKHGISNPVGQVKENLLSVCQWHEVVKRKYRVVDGKEILVEVSKELRPPIEGCLKFYLTNRDPEHWENTNKIDLGDTKLVIEGGDGLDV